MRIGRVLARGTIVSTGQKDETANQSWLKDLKDDLRGMPLITPSGSYRAEGLTENYCSPNQGKAFDMRHQKWHRGENPNIRRQAEEREKALRDDSDNGGVESTWRYSHSKMKQPRWVYSWVCSRNHCCVWSDKYLRCKTWTQLSAWLCFARLLSLVLLCTFLTI